jgi:hypothetical protein
MRFTESPTLLSPFKELAQESGFSNTFEQERLQRYGELIVCACAGELEKAGMVEVAQELKHYFGVR